MTPPPADRRRDGPGPPRFPVQPLPPGVLGRAGFVLRLRPAPDFGLLALFVQTVRDLELVDEVSVTTAESGETDLLVGSAAGNRVLTELLELEPRPLATLTAGYDGRLIARLESAARAVPFRAIVGVPARTQSRADSRDHQSLPPEEERTDGGDAAWEARLLFPRSGAYAAGSGVGVARQPAPVRPRPPGTRVATPPAPSRRGTIALAASCVSVLVAGVAAIVYSARNVQGPARATLDTPTPAATVPTSPATATPATTPATVTATPNATATRTATATPTLPPTVTPTLTATATATPAETITPLPESGRYTVKAGETVASVAVYFGAREQDLRAVNGLSPTAEVKVGDALIIPR